MIFRNPPNQLGRRPQVQNSRFSRLKSKPTTVAGFVRTGWGVICKRKTNSGLVKYQPKGDPADWAAAAKGILATEKPDAIVVMLGLDDRQPIREAAADKSDKEPQAGCKIGCQGRQDRRSETRHRREAR